MSVEISVVVCTHNRARYLPVALESLLQQTLAKSRYEIVVVDNASTDGTGHMLERRFGHHAGLRVVNEPRLGCSVARNTGWRSARAALVAYLDDDAVACADWLERIVAAFARLPARTGAVGGRVDPIWETPRPDWLPDSLLPLLTTLDHGGRARRLGEGLYLIGTNIAYPRAVLPELGGYHEELGPVGARYRAGEETVLQRELRSRGYDLYYDPEIRVRHHLHRERLEKRWLRRRMFQEGLSRAQVELVERDPSRRERWRMLGRGAHKVVSSPRRLIALAAPWTTPELFRRQASSCRRIGYLMGLLGAGRGRFAYRPAARDSA